MEKAVLEFTRVVFLFVLFVTVLMATVTSAASQSAPLKATTLNEQTIELGDQRQYPLVIVAHKGLDQLPTALNLFLSLHTMYPMQVYLLVRPDMPFFVPYSVEKGILRDEIDSSVHQYVLHDENNLLMDRFGLSRANEPMVFLLKQDQSIVGRYFYKTPQTAYQFIVGLYHPILEDRSGLDVAEKLELNTESIN